jgi:hypothetical protein
MRFEHLEPIALFLVTCIGCDATQSSSGKPPALVELVGQWRYTELGRSDAGTPFKTFTYTFRADGTFALSAVTIDGTEVDFCGSYDVCDDRALRLTIPEKGSQMMRYSLAEPVLTIRDPELDSYVRLERVGAAAASVAAQPSPPSAEQVMDWAAFSKRVHLEREEIPPGDFSDWGDPVWIYVYSAKNETLSVYCVGLYKVGALFGKNRVEVEQFVAEEVETRQELGEKYSGQNDKEMAEHSRIETRAGVGFCGFTTVGQYDLMLYHIAACEDVPPEDKIKNPAEPTNGLSDIFKKLEKHIAARE